MASTGEVWKLGHRPALDGVRGIAVLLVVIGHAFPATFGGGGPVGVTTFFALSGFLITALLLEEHALTGRINLRAFYVRRARRLLPALVTFLAVMVTLSFLVHPMLGDPRAALMALFYVANFYDGPLNGLGHTWSLSVEEQFYLAWPLLVLLILRRRARWALLLVTMAGVLVSVAVRLVLWGTPFQGEIGHGTPANAASLLVGCLLAVAMTRGLVKRRAAPWVLPSVVAVLIVLGCAPDTPSRILWLPVVAAALATAALWAACSGSGSWLASRWLTLVGQRSYGLYLWHFPIVAIFAYGGGPIERLIAIAASWVVALLSWRFVEQPFLRAKTQVTRPPAEVRTAGQVSPSPAIG